MKRMYVVTVGQKPSNHPFYGQGSKYCFYIDGIPGKQLDLVPGITYKFTINTPGHPFYFTTSKSGGSQDNNSLEGFPPTDNGEVSFTMTDSYPDEFYYHCRIHTYMGGFAYKSHNTFYLTPLLDGLVAPTSLAAPNGSDDVYVADQIGLIYKYNTTSKQASIFLDVRQYIPELGSEYEERGLLGLCFHPNFDTNGRFFIYYSSVPDREGQGYDVMTKYYNCLSEFVYNNGRILYEAEKVLIRIPRDLNYHNGGKIGFGSDGYLYITVGDGGPQQDTNGNAQNLGVLLGKILRIDVNGVDSYPYYKIPNDNPFINVPNARPEIWAYGFRNPWGLEFVNMNSDNVLIVTDAGYESGSGQEEVNIVVRGGNYGWNIKEGSNLAPWAQTKDQQFLSQLKDPIFAYTTSDSKYADSDVSTIIGGYLDKSGDYICADYSGRLIRLGLSQKDVIVVEVASVQKSNEKYWIRSFGKTRGNCSIEQNNTMFGKIRLCPNQQLYLLTSKSTGPKGNTGEVYLLDIS